MIFHKRPVSVTERPDAVTGRNAQQTPCLYYNLLTSHNNPCIDSEFLFRVNPVEMAKGHLAALFKGVPAD